MNNIMIDLETLGRSQDSVIAQIAAVQFDPKTGEIGAEFCVNVDIESSKYLMKNIDASTVKWWLKQPKEAIESVFFSDNPKGLLDSLKQFCEWLNTIKVNFGDLVIWANSPSFDCEILKHAFSKSPYPILWDFRNERDFRTVSKLFPQVAENHKRVGTAHSALDDCRNQVAILCECLRLVYDVRY
jgi:3' exoribonuclease, RNase T-like